MKIILVPAFVHVLDPTSTLVGLECVLWEHVLCDSVVLAGQKPLGRRNRSLHGTSWPTLA